MRVRSTCCFVSLFASLLDVSSAFAQQPNPPTPPLPWARPSIRGPIQAGEKPASPNETTVVIPLSAGLSLISVPLRLTSEKLSDIFPNLPAGSRAWIWDASHQRFLEGFDHQLPLGHACWLYVPVPTRLAFTGRPNRLQHVSFDLEKGWNLIGVPYGTALLRSHQQVYVDRTRKPLHDAVVAGNAGPSIFSFGVNGHQTVAANGSFEPTHGYWVYASGADLLETERPGVSNPPGVEFPWETVLSEVGSLIMTQMGYGDEAMLEKTLAKLDDIAQTQTALDAKLNAVLTEIEVSKVEILQKIGNATYVAPVQNALLSYYDEENPNTSLAWFVAKAKAGAGPSVPMDIKSNFARHVLNDWKFIEQFNLIKAGISPMAAGDKGLLDNFADQVVLTSGPYDLKDRYIAMETYFSTLVGMQIKCATLIMNAYDQLGNDPSSTDGYTPQTAAAWKKDVFDRVIQEETYRFLKAVEGMAVKKLPVPTTWSDPAVKVPDDVQVVIGLADLYVMETLNTIDRALEPPGVRVRIMLNPGAGADLPRLIWKRNGVLELPHITTLPSFDTWQTYTGARDYDDWTLSPGSSAPEFKITSDWKMVRVILPVTAPATVMMATMGNSDWWATADSNSTVSATITQSGTPFGSITIARRPTANEVFDPCRGWPVITDVTNHCNIVGDCDRGGVTSCNTRYLHASEGCEDVNSDAALCSTLTMTYRFVYRGGHPKAGTWTANAYGTVTFNERVCDPPRLYYELFKGEGQDPRTIVNSTLIHMWSMNDGGVQRAGVTWEPETIYTFKVRLQIGMGDRKPSAACEAYYFAYKGAQMTFP